MRPAGQIDEPFGGGHRGAKGLRDPADHLASGGLRTCQLDPTLSRVVVERHTVGRLVSKSPLEWALFCT